MILTVIDWIFKSSADPAKTSLMVKGAIVVFIPYVLQFLSLICTFGLLCLNIDETWLREVVDLVGMTVNVVLTAVGGVIFIVGGVRKLWRTFKGENKVIG